VSRNPSPPQSYPHVGGGYPSEQFPDRFLIKDVENDKGKRFPPETRGNFIGVSFLSVFSPSFLFDVGIFGRREVKLDGVHPTFENGIPDPANHQQRQALRRARMTAPLWKRKERLNFSG
jgi:hypothetical protein